jgi:transposase
MLPVMTSLADRLLPEELWQRIQPLLPPPPRPRGGVPRHVPDRNCVAALIFMTRTSTPWVLLPAKELGGGSATTCWRRLDQWAKAGVFDQLQALLLDELGAAGRIDLERVSVDSFSLRAVKGDLTGANPVDRGKAGSKLHVAGDRGGLPLSVVVSAANANDATMLRRCWTTSHRSGCPAGGGDVGRPRSMPTRPTIIAAAAPTFAGEAFGHGSPGA